MTNLFIYLTVVVSGGSILAIEILGARVLGPYYGASLYLWTALIGVTLAALGTGYAVGSRWASRGPRLTRFCVLIGFAGLWIAALNVKYRDFRIIVPFVVQFGLYISPVGFSSNIVPEKWRLLYSVNPMVGVIDGFRWSILGGETRLYWPGFMLSLALVLVILVTGIHYFRKTEKTFADVI